MKLDIALVRDIDTDPARQALAAGLRHYADQSGAILSSAQGYLFGRPEPLD